MIDVVSIKFKSRGKCYYFSPNDLDVHTGDKVIVETSKGLEIADCVHGNHGVMDTAVVQPLRPVLRIATSDDLRIAQLNIQREKDAFKICQEKIAKHGLDMKLVDVECNFEGTKTMFFFTSDGRVDFRELVKDLASVFRNRIELRQIGVRDEAKMIGGIGICGRPYCCSQFLDDFQPVSTKMAKIQSLSLNPAKISGSCGRLMCCLRYEQDAYEDLLKKVPKQGAFVETKDGFGTAVQVNLLRQTVKVRLDDDGDDSLHLYKSSELCTVPGGRPKEGEAPISTLEYVPEVEPEVEATESGTWFAEPQYSDPAFVENSVPLEEPRRPSRRHRSRRSHSDEIKTDPSFKSKKAEIPAESDKQNSPVVNNSEESKQGEREKRDNHSRRYGKNRSRGAKSEPGSHSGTHSSTPPKKNTDSQKSSSESQKKNPAPQKKGFNSSPRKNNTPQKNASNATSDNRQEKENFSKPKSNRRRFYHGKPKSHNSDKVQ